MLYSFLQCCLQVGKGLKLSPVMNFCPGEGRKHGFEDLYPTFRQIEGEQGTLLASAASQLPSAQNNSYAKMAYSGSIIFCCSLWSTIKSWGQTHRSFEDYSKCTISNTVTSRSSIPVSFICLHFFSFTYEITKS